jgi:hypothetical protein
MAPWQEWAPLASGQIAATLAAADIIVSPRVDRLIGSTLPALGGPQTGCGLRKLAVSLVDVSVCLSRRVAVGVFLMHWKLRGVLIIPAIAGWLVYEYGPVKPAELPPAPPACSPSFTSVWLRGNRGAGMQQLPKGLCLISDPRRKQECVANVANSQNCFLTRFQYVCGARMRRVAIVVRVPAPQDCATRMGGRTGGRTPST